MRTLKDSGIEWIGEVGSEYKLYKVKHIFEILDQFRSPIAADKRSQEAEILYDYYGASGAIDKIDNYTIDDHVMLIGEDGANLRMRNLPLMYEVNGKAWINNHAHILKPKDNMDFRFLFFAMESLDINPYITGSAQPKLSQDNLKNMYVPVHSFEEQQSISAHLDNQCAHIDNIIEKTKASIEEYKKLRQAVITQAVTKGVRGERAMKDSGIEWIGEIPEEWEFVKITRILKENHPYPIGDGDHGLIKTEDYLDSGIPYLRVQNLGWGTPLQVDNVVYISEERNEQIKNSILRPNDVLFAKTGATIGKTGIIPEDLPISNTTSHIGKITVSDKYSAKFVFYFLSSKIGFRQFWEIAIQKTTRPELSIEETKSIRILLPDTYKEQAEIAAFLDEKCRDIDSIIDKKEQFLSDLESYKKSLIYEYVTGKKEVPQA